MPENQVAFTGGLILAICLLLSILFTPEQRDEIPPEEQASQEAAGNSNSEPLVNVLSNLLPAQAGEVLVAANAVTPPAGDTSNNEEPQDPEGDEFYEFWDLFAQLAMAAFALVLCGLTLAGVILSKIGVQYLGMTLQSNLMLIEQTRTANRVALQAASAAHEAVKVTREIGRAEIRGYPRISEINVAVLESSRQYTASLHCINDGKTMLTSPEVLIVISGHGDIVFEFGSPAVRVIKADGKPHCDNWSLELPIPENTFNAAEIQGVILTVTVALHAKDVLGLDVYCGAKTGMIFSRKPDVPRYRSILISLEKSAFGDSLDLEESEAEAIFRDREKQNPC